MKEKLKQLAISPNWHDPLIVLAKLAVLNNDLLDSNLDKRIRTLRTNDLKGVRQLWEAAMFCHCMSERSGEKIYLLPEEDSDWDFLAGTKNENVINIVPVQLKEFPPEDLNSGTTLDSILIGIHKKSFSPSDTVLALRINRTTHIDINKTKFDGLPFKQVYLFGSISQDASEYLVCGDLLKDSYLSRHQMPYKNCA